MGLRPETSRRDKSGILLLESAETEKLLALNLRFRIQGLFSFGSGVWGLGRPLWLLLYSFGCLAHATAIVHHESDNLVRHG